MDSTQSPPHIVNAVESDGWRTVVFVTWVAVTAALIAISISSRTTGRPVWWLGPSTQPAPLFYLLFPVVLVAIPLYASFRKPRLMGQVGVGCSLLLGASALIDLADKPGVAAALFVVAFAALCESIAVTVVSRQYR